MDPGTTDSPGGRGAERYRFGPVVVDVAAHELTREGELRPLEPKAFAVLVELLRHHGELLTRDQLLDAVWGHRHVTPGVLTRAIARARAALGDDSHSPRYIQTQHALGYRFIAPLDPAPTPPDEAAQPAAAAPARRVVPATRLGRRSADRWRHWLWALGSAALLTVAVWLLARLG